MKNTNNRLAKVHAALDGMAGFVFSEGEFTQFKQAVDKIVEGKVGKEGEAKPLPRIITRAEAQRLAHLSRTSINSLANAGVLVRVYTPNSKQAIGYTEASVRAFLEGRSAAAAAATAAPAATTTTAAEGGAQ